MVQGIEAAHTIRKGQPASPTSFSSPLRAFECQVNRWIFMYILMIDMGCEGRASDIWMGHPGHGVVGEPQENRGDRQRGDCPAASSPRVG